MPHSSSVISLPWSSWSGASVSTWTTGGAEPSARSNISGSTVISPSCRYQNVHMSDMWTFWYLQEGEITVDPLMFDRADGSAPPVVHVDTDAPLHDDHGKLITDELWGIYYKRDRHGVQGGASPLTVGPDFDVDPYPTASVDPAFPDMWCAALSHCMQRFEGCRPLYKDARSGGAGAFTADNFPVFDY